MEPFLNVFDQDAFSFTALTDSINKLPFVPGTIGRLGIFSEMGVPFTSVMIEEQQGQLSLVDPSPRGSPGETRPKLPRTARLLRIPHYQHDDTIVAEEVQGVREFGQNAGMRTPESFMASRMAIFTQNLDVTLEYTRMGALNGIVLDKSGNVLLNLFTEFGVTAPTPITFSLTDLTTDPRIYCAKVSRTMARNLGGVAFSGVMGLASDEFWDAFITHPLVRETYKYQQGAVLRENFAYEQVDYGGVRIMNIKAYIAPLDGGADDGSDARQFVTAGQCQFFPMGVPNLFRTYFAPADYMDTVNTIGLPRYARVTPFPNYKGASLEIQMNPLSICTRPRSLIRGVLG